MLTPSMLDALEANLGKLNPDLTPEELEEATAFIGDTPMVDNQGRVLWITDSGEHRLLNWSDD